MDSGARISLEGAGKHKTAIGMTLAALSSLGVNVAQGINASAEGDRCQEIIMRQAESLDAFVAQILQMVAGS